MNLLSYGLLRTNRIGKPHAEAMPRVTSHTVPAGAAGYEVLPQRALVVAVGN